MLAECSDSSFNSIKSHWESVTVEFRLAALSLSSGICCNCKLASDFEQVAEKIMIMHEECLDCNFKSIESLREANSQRVPTHVKQVLFTTLCIRSLGNSMNSPNICVVEMPVDVGFWFI